MAEEYIMLIEKALNENPDIIDLLSIWKNKSRIGNDMVFQVKVVVRKKNPRSQGKTEILCEPIPQECWDQILAQEGWKQNLRTVLENFQQSHKYDQLWLSHDSGLDGIKFNRPLDAYEIRDYWFRAFGSIKRRLRLIGLPYTMVWRGGECGIFCIKPKT